MPIKLSAPIEETHFLTRSDAKYGTDGEPTFVAIRQATQLQNERRSGVYSEVTQVYDERDAGVKLRQRWSMEELKRMDVFLTLVGCNLNDEDGNQLFRFKSDGKRQFLDMSDAEFNKAWGKLPPDVAQEIHEKVLKVNLTWASPLGSND